MSVAGRLSADGTEKSTYSSRTWTDFTLLVSQEMLFMLDLGLRSFLGSLKMVDCGKGGLGQTSRWED